MQVSKAQLTPQRQGLVALLQRINFGSIEGLRIAAGQPCLDPRPAIARDIKLGASDNGPRPELSKADFLLKTQILEMFALFDEIRDGVIELVEVKAGLPFRIVLREHANV